MLILLKKLPPKRVKVATQMDGGLRLWTTLEFYRKLHQNEMGGWGLPSATPLFWSPTGDA